MNSSVDDLLKKLKAEMEKDSEIEIFNRDEVNALRRVIKFMELLESWGKLGKAALWLITAFAGLLIAYEQIATRLVGK